MNMMRRSLRIAAIEGEPVPDSEFSFTLTRVAVAQICQSMGFKGAQNSALEALTDVATRYLQAVAKLGAASANSDCRTESNIADIIVALEDLASIQGFWGLSSVRSVSLYTSSAMVKDLMKFVKYTDEIPFARPLPLRINYNYSQGAKGKFMMKCNNNNSNSNSNRGYCDVGSWRRHVPRWLPAQPVVVVEGKEKKGLEKKKEIKWGCLELELELELDGGEEEDENHRGHSERKEEGRAAFH